MSGCGSRLLKLVEIFNKKGEIMVRNKAAVFAIIGLLLFGIEGLSQPAQRCFVLSLEVSQQPSAEFEKLRDGAMRVLKR